ncbi:MAG TPA: OmpA family protein [Bacteroidales bacterium]|nr:OmpA family protein [Bacteroidales bacterium]
MKYISIIVFILVFQGFAYSQSFHTNSNKALKAYTDGMLEFDYMNLSSAERLLKQAISLDARFYEAHLMIGDLFFRQKRYSEAVQYYRNAVYIDSLFYKPVFFNLANAEMNTGEYKRALVHFKAYLEQQGMSEKNRKAAQLNILNCEYAIKAIENPVPFNPQSVGAGINTTDDEYWPSITADGSTLIFTKQPATRNGSNGPAQEDFYISIFSDNTWQKAVNAGYPLNTQQNEGAQSLSSDGRYMYFTACDRKNSVGSCDIYYAFNSEGKWSEPVNLKSPVNSRGWESQPSISADGRTLFFSSNRPGGFGGKDIWMSKKNDNNEWSNPVNPGDLINSEGDEMSPFIHFDGQTLYFSSNGKTGMGGFDIFRTTLKEDSSWTEPQNLGYPINTFNDETGLIIGSGGNHAYFSSIRDKTNGKDIYYFDLYESARPNPVSYIKGKVYNRETGQLISADYELINLTTGNIVLKNSTDINGAFLVCLPSGFNYGINVSKPGYLFYSESFMFEGEHSISEPFNKKIVLNPAKVGEKMQLSNVFYEVNSWELKKESIMELNNLASLLSSNKDIVIEIGGYTDSTGTDAYNLNLSEKRALSVVNYLVNKGIPASRLKYKGYGNTDPVGNNVTSEGRKLNRRTEAKVVAQKTTD